jgi:predicted membrane channel-forming protein YqfA (hemolysin III family)
MVVAAGYPLLEVTVTMFAFFVCLAWPWLVVVVVGDIVRRTDLSGRSRALWIALAIVLPIVGALIYVVADDRSMAAHRIHEPGRVPRMDRRLAS